MHPWLRSLLACSAVALSAIGASACGAGKSPGSALREPTGATSSGGVVSSSASGSALADALREHDGDGDNDSLGMGHDDPDGDAAPTFAAAASTTDRRGIVALIGQYYAAAAAGDGAKACSLTYRLFAETLVEEHERDRGPASLRGNTCARIASKSFDRRHRELVADVAALQVGVVQVHLNRGWAVLRFGGAHERLAFVHREHGGWRMNGLLDNGPL